MAVASSRRGVLHFGCGTVAALGVSAVAGAFGPERALAQGASANNASAEDFFYREDWFGEPWRKPETAVLIHGNAESSIVWYAWLPRMAQEFRVLRPDLPGLGRSRIPAGFEWSLSSLAAFVAHVMDKAGDLDGIMRSIRVGKQNSDFVVVAIHCHQNSFSYQAYSHDNSTPDFLIELAHKAIDNGADVFVGHGVHTNSLVAWGAK